MYGVELKPDFSGVIGEPQLLLCPPSKIDDAQAEWASRSVTSSENPLGPCTKAANNPVLQKNTAEGGIVTGTGHNMVLTIDGQRYIVYHAYTTADPENRVVMIDRLNVADGVLTVDGPTTGNK